MRKLLATVLLATMIPALASALPNISIPEKTWDFGLAHKGGQLSHPYWIKNIGDDTLKITVKPG